MKHALKKSESLRTSSVLLFIFPLFVFSKHDKKKTSL